MGGLVARSACHHATAVVDVDNRLDQFNDFNSHNWLARLEHVVFLGTPHHGAMLERGGKWVDHLLAANHYSEPFARLGKIRSNGVMDLGYGNVREEDWQDDTADTDTAANVGGQQRRRGPGDGRLPTPLPCGVKCYAIAAVATAATSEEQSDDLNLRDHVIGDGLVTVSSALGQGHVNNPELNLSIPLSHQKIVRGVGHAGLLSSKEVYDTIRTFLES